MPYIEADDADDRLGEICLSSELTAWTALDDGDKEILISRAVEKLESLSFRGSKYDMDQEELFPRYDQYGYYDYTEEDGCHIPQAILDAICLEAVAIVASSGGSYAQIDTLQEHGVKSVRISGTGLQYEFTGSPSATRGGFVSERAWKLISRYLARDVMTI
ncbi:MAG: DnaT-like ssDNA-binding protein [Methanothrix sp.]